MKPGNRAQNSKPVQSIEDMIRIAKRVNSKLRSSLTDLEKEIEQIQEEIKAAGKIGGAQLCLHPRQLVGKWLMRLT